MFNKYATLNLLHLKHQKKLERIKRWETLFLDFF
jgi:hypothetical protein